MNTACPFRCAAGAPRRGVVKFTALAGLGEGERQARGLAVQKVAQEKRLLFMSSAFLLSAFAALAA